MMQERCVQYVLVSERKITKAADGRSVLVLDHWDRQCELDLPAGADATFKGQLGRVDAFAGRVLEFESNQRLVLGKCLGHEDRTPEVELAARPARVCTEGADVIEHRGDFGGRQRIAK